MTTCYISCACNRVPHSIDWGRNKLICYAACNAVAIYNPDVSKIGKVLQTLYGHKNRINTVQWIKFGNEDPETEILSCSSDGTAIIWSNFHDSFKCTSILNVGEIVTFSNYLYLDNTFNDTSFNKLLICTGSSTGDLKLWLRNDDNNVVCFQTLTFGRKLPIEAFISYLPYSNYSLLVIALDDSSIQLYTQSSKTTDLNFEKAQILLGHEDWIRCIDITKDIEGNILIATGSQDATIRLWKISIHKEEKSIEEILEQKKHLFEVNGIKYNTTLESVLCGHEGWIYGVHWYPVKKQDGINQNSTKLLSCSLDKSMIIWEPDPATGIWCETVRVGEVGGNSLGFYTCKFSPDGLNILAHSYHGSFHIWQYTNSAKDWIPRFAPNGHFEEVVDLCWDPKGRFLITTSTDQTTRIHAPYKDGLTELWHEIGRPQVHGYNMACLAILKPYMFASGAEEKVVRIFTAPSNFKKYLTQIADTDDFENMVAEGANVPALGLTNKAIFDTEVKRNENCLKNEDYNPLTEEELMQDTLWPELQKLYGHGYEIFSMAARYDGLLLATACRSTSPEYSTIILWDTKIWSQIQKLSSHQLTVTQLSFSPNGKYLLSVSRDRRWSLFECNENFYNLVACSSKRDNLHSRIIWCCAWSHDSLYFVTGSRDGKIGIWDETVKEVKPIVPLTSLDVQNQSVTALSFAPLKIEEYYILAVGYEAGHIEIYKLILKTEDCLWKKYIMYNTAQAHHLTVKRLAFRPQNNNQYNKLQLASCGSDHTVKIYNIDTFKNKDL
ncbi:probable elongator complex protein 2 [Vespa crabro]|uniref:probable elongator complex protein 2 n=1 Tax=Vespa crabro TaxID=7445 RepID=UPI001F02FEC5|nr:probable elongator complex protein 2 [Vespa crabro]